MGNFLIGLLILCVLFVAVIHVFVALFQLLLSVI
jgi:hypothetical protein